MNFEQAERRFRELQKHRDRGNLDDNQFRVEVAKLLFRDAQGVFWMIDADDGTWLRNRGESWEVSDPSAEGSTESAPETKRRPRRWGVVASAVALGALLGLISVIVLQQWSILPWNSVQPEPTNSLEVQVAIASPADGSRVALDQEVAIESTIQSASGLQVVDRVELQVNGQTVISQPLRPKLQPGQTSLPLSQLWLPTSAGEYQVTVSALSAQGEPLGQATITLNAAEASDETLPEPACTPGATLVGDVTIPPGTAFRPNTEMEKVWQVRNSGTCAWGMGYELTRVGGEELGAPDTVTVPPTAADASADLAVPFQAPEEAGAYTNTWQLRSPDGTLFGPLLGLSIVVESQAQESLAPNTPADLKATVAEDGEAVRLTWQDRSDNEDAFRVHREDVEASIGLAPANAQLFIDNAVTCGNTYRYGVVAFNAVGASPMSEVAEVSLPRCAPTDAPPTLILTVVPTEVLASEPITIVFQANDDMGVTQVTVQGEETGQPELDAGRTFPCSGVICAGSWPVTSTAEFSTTLVLVAVARDSSGQESEPARMTVTVRPRE
jgi:hypothetical protein